MIFDELTFIPMEANGYAGFTAFRASAWFDNEFGLSIVTGTRYDLKEGEYDVMGLVEGTVCGKVLAGTATYQPHYPAYFEQEERRVDVARVNQMLAEVEAMPIDSMAVR